MGVGIECLRKGLGAGKAGIGVEVGVVAGLGVPHSLFRVEYNKTEYLPRKRLCRRIPYEGFYNYIFF